MAKKELPDKKAPKEKEAPFSAEPSGLGGDFSAKISGLSSKAFGIIKFILGILILPFVYSSLSSFLHEFGLVNKELQWMFFDGVICFLGVYLFIWEPAAIYNRGHRLIEIVFSFLKPMVNVAPFILPIYTILFFVLYGLLSLGIKDRWLTEYMLFLVGFSAILHLVFSAKTIRTKKGDFLKGNYIFGFSFIFILNLALLSLCFSFIFSEFSFVNFCNISFAIAKNIFYVILKQLFVF